MKYPNFKLKYFLLLALCTSLWPSISLAVFAVIPCNELAFMTTPASQFLDNGDGTITDQKNNLIWQKCPEGQSGNFCEIGNAQTYTWQGALQRVDSLNSSTGFANSVDWRLPNIKELLSIVEHGCTPAINPEVFPGLPSSPTFWSSTPNNSLLYVDQGSLRIMTILFSNGITSNHSKSDLLNIRLVRSAP